MPAGVLGNTLASEAGTQGPKPWRATKQCSSDGNMAYLARSKRVVSRFETEVRYQIHAAR